MGGLSLLLDFNAMLCGSSCIRSQPQIQGPNATTPANTAFPNLSNAALSWTDPNSVRQFRVYHTTPSNSSEASRIIESSWDSAAAKWSVEPITNPPGDSLEAGTPMAAAACYPHTNTKIALVKNVYLLQPSGRLVERQSPYKDQAGIWGNDNFSGLYTASNLSAVFSYWYQNFDTRLQVLINFFHEIGETLFPLHAISRTAPSGGNGKVSDRASRLKTGRPLLLPQQGAARTCVSTLVLQTE
ncbi:hypothetical protein QBC43DRAFT_365343 [Cladorrhinum sp. PSN259]|nr:hypothetical protein QBC43DRAFT_365343 [Cladorrhinum sp. PSN259]